jgi:hypothetical protein
MDARMLNSVYVQEIGQNQPAGAGHENPSRDILNESG